MGGPCYKVPTFHIRYGGPYVIDSYKVPTLKSYCKYGETPLNGSHIQYKVWRDHKSLSYKVHTFHIRYGGS